MSTIVFDTPGLIDLRAFTVMGMSAKPNTENPIGYFGTGLKYAMAVMVRLGAEPRVWIGRDQHVFLQERVSFRGADFVQLKLRSLRWGLSRWRTTQLPFTTQHGRNWQAWMAFRELEANTRDESGRTILLPKHVEEVEGIDGRTRIAIEHPDMVRAYEGMADLFLPEARREGSGVQVLPGRRTEHVYYRGLNVWKTPKPCLHTYNLLSFAELTEDRTLKYEFAALGAVGRAVAASDDETFIESVVTAKQEWWESAVPAPSYSEPGEAFHRVMARLPRKRVGGSWGSWYAGHRPLPAGESYRLYAEHPAPWRRLGDEIMDTNGRVMLAKPLPVRGALGSAGGADMRDGG